MSWTIQKKLEKVAEERWNSWLLKHGSVFHLSHFAEGTRQVGFEPMYASLCDSSHTTVAQTTLFIKRVGIGPIKLRWCVFFAEPSYSKSLNLDLQASYFKDLINQASAFKLAYVATTGSMARFSTEIPEKAEQIPFGTFEIDLGRSEDTLWENLHSKHRNSVRAAQKTGILVEESTDINAFYNLLTHTLARTKEPAPPQSYINAVFQSLHPNGYARLFSATQDSQIHASALILLTQERAYYWFGATAPSSATGSGNLLHWEIIRALKRCHVRTYDLGGARPHVPESSKLFGIYRFKERFGGQFISAPQWKLTLSSSKSRMLSQLQKVKRLVRAR